MAWVEKAGTCEICGKPIRLKSSRQKYCDECAEYKKKHKTTAQKKREAERMYRKRHGIYQDGSKEKEHECQVKGSCVYGSKDSCMYWEVEGHSRMLAGYRIKGGRCELYKKGKKKIEKLRVPRSHPAMSVNKIREV